MKAFQNIQPVGKFVRLDNVNLVLDVTPNLETFNVEGVYKLDGRKVEWGTRATEAGETLDERFMNGLYDELDRGKYFDLPKPKEDQTKEAQAVTQGPEM
jgi:hypothetical protein